MPQANDSRNIANFHGELLSCLKLHIFVSNGKCGSWSGARWEGVWMNAVRYSSITLHTFRHLTKVPWSAKASLPPILPPHCASTWSPIKMQLECNLCQIQIIHLMPLLRWSDTFKLSGKRGQKAAELHVDLNMFSFIYKLDFKYPSLFKWTRNEFGVLQLLEWIIQAESAPKLRKRSTTCV